MTPFCIFPQPIRRQCLSTRRLRAIFSPSFVQTGDTSESLARSFFTASTFAPVHMEPMLSISTSCLLSLVTLLCFWSPCVRTPNSRRNKKKFTSNSVYTSGNVLTSPRTCPTKRSARVRVGSIVVPTPIKPPGTANSKRLFSDVKDTIRDLMGVQVMLPLLSFDTIPGRTSISWPFFRTPCKILPPATPPLMLSTSEPGLFTSKERITIISGDEVKSRTGTGIFLTMYSATASILYFSCAEMGTIGAPSAMVP
mmetsp:Transcript_11437/g.41850  ORF Transcript_11437/g.41850 Transcript_11437/m.41850 type:complete len:253 (+) Transcript_11437:140-898(+)